KPVQLWQQGEARVLVNRGRPAPEDWPRGDAQVSAIAVESEDPDRCARRAQAFLAPAVPRRHAAGEAALRAAAAPDPPPVVFRPTDRAARRSWLLDFASVPVDNGADPDVVRRVDHIALSHPAVHLDEAALFYQSVLGLRRSTSAESADPYGLVRSRAVRNAS